jgi:hypothetical protein
MENKPFDKPVHIVFGKPGQHRNVTSVREAAEVLLDDNWPTEAGRRHLAARKACLAVLQGLKEAREARKAFEDAAWEADILRDAPERPPRSAAPVPRWRKKTKLKRDT